MIEMVQHTDLSKHFDFITRLKTLAASKGHAAHVKQYQGQGGSFGKHAEGGAHEGAVSRDGPRKPAGRRGSGSGSERRRTLFMVASSKPGEPPAQLARRGSKEGTPRRRPSATTEQANRGSFDPTKRRKSLVTSLVLSLNGTDQLDEPPPPPPPPWKTPYLSEDVDVRLVVATALKFADLGHSFKPFHLHEQACYLVIIRAIVSRLVIRPLFPSYHPYGRLPARAVDREDHRGVLAAGRPREEHRRAHLAAVRPRARPQHRAVADGLLPVHMQPVPQGTSSRE